MAQFGQLFASFWQMFSELQVPILGISFATLYLGIFAVTFSILILRPILGIGQAFANNNVNLIGRARNAKIARENRAMHKYKYQNFKKNQAEKKKGN